MIKTVLNLRNDPHDHHDISVVSAELWAREVHGERQPGVVEGELGLESDLVLLVRHVLHPDVGGREGDDLALIITTIVTTITITLTNNILISIPYNIQTRIFDLKCNMPSKNLGHINNNNNNKNNNKQYHNNTNNKRYQNKNNSN